MKIIKKIATILVIIILLCVLFVSGVILINSYVHPDEVPSFFGWKPFIVLSGSMESKIMTGDIVVVKEVDTSILKEGDIIAFKYDDIVVTHRIVKIEEIDGKVQYRTKGDNNNTEDTDYVLPEQVEGLYKFRVARLGNLAIFIQTPIGMIICVSIPIIILVLLQLSDSIQDKKIIQEKEEKQRKIEEELERLKKENEKLTKQ